MKDGRTLLSLAAEIDRQRAAKRDLVAPTTAMHHVTDAGGASLLCIDTPDGLAQFGIGDLARRQLADRLKIPFAYFERMRASQPALLDRNVDAWLHADVDRRLVRTLDGRVRAFLSDRYRRLDHYDLAEHVLPLLQRLPEARFESVELTEKRLYLKIVTPRLQLEMRPGDIVQAGVIVSNSEVGCGSVSVRPLLYRLVCRNGLIAADAALRRTHVGRLLGSEDEGVTLFRHDTLQAEDTAFFLKMRDVVEAAVSEVSFHQLAEKMRRTLGIELAADPVKAVDALGTHYLLNEAERCGVLRHLINGGELSAYGLVNAVTHYSQQLGDYDRATDLEEIGGRLIEQSAAEWREIAQAT